MQFTQTLKAFATSALLGGAAMAGTAHAADYVIDTEGAHASIQFKISHLGFSWLKGRFNDFEGDFSYDADNPEAAEITVTIDTASIDSNHADRDAHLRSADFLDVEQFPQARFVSTDFIPHDDGEATLEGELTLRGITRDIAIDVEKIGEGEDPWGNYRVGFSGETEFRLEDYGIDYELGPTSEVVYLELEVEGIQQ
ncbi:YceI family protein [Spiribacter pallidus]|uniref:YceI family protein n=1 Tax=Spiribacter pallidus TaxID=1987936 RepID=A0ABV3TBE6_9GAMM